MTAKDLINKQTWYERFYLPSEIHENPKGIVKFTYTFIDDTNSMFSCVAHRIHKNVVVETRNGTGMILEDRKLLVEFAPLRESLLFKKQFNRLMDSFMEFMNAPEEVIIYHIESELSMVVLGDALKTKVWILTAEQNTIIPKDFIARKIQTLGFDTTKLVERK